MAERLLSWTATRSVLSADDLKGIFTTAPGVTFQIFGAPLIPTPGPDGDIRRLMERMDEHRTDPTTMFVLRLSGDDQAQLDTVAQQIADTCIARSLPAPEITTPKPAGRRSGLVVDEYHVS